ncbi:hypothetical protein J2X66_002832, partial [Pseudomonas sp. 3296]|nr:hypothetical protein [Pseudomonas sp. 3296]
MTVHTGLQTALSFICLGIGRYPDNRHFDALCAESPGQ